uniref:Phosphate transporter n=1 Tax=Phallusia mammillata TaxID=59560 RepID=A0A6F9DRR2_9ASCI|nr:sodium-dependent phosphate transporter 1-A [Phallusia mammillata]
MSATTAFVSNAYAAVTTAISTTVPFILEDWQASVLWILIAGFVIAFILAFAVGANDVANSFGTTVGAGTLTLKQACILASIFETLGAILLGAKVGATIRKGIIDIDIYIDNETLLMAGEISAMFASGLWQLIATFFKIPVSGTHSIVGATVGFSLVAHGVQGVNWKKMGLIVGSWFCSPVLAGGMAAIFYYVLRKLIFQKKDPVRPGLIAMPIMYGCTIAINCFSVLFSGAPLLGFDKLAPWVDIIIAICIGIAVGLLVQLVMVKKMKAAINAEKNDICNQMLIVEKPTPPMPGHKKTIKLPTVMESIAEKEATDESFNTFNENGSGEKKQLDTVPVLPSYNKTQAANDFNGVEKSKRVRIHSEHQVSPKTIEEAKTLRQQRSKRSKSVGQESHGSVRIPPLLQLEKSVLKTTIPSPSVQDIQEEIRRNFSEPAMVTLTEKSDADIYEVFINRQRKMITIQRKHSASCDPLESAVREGSQGSELEIDHVSSALLGGTKLDEPFDDSDEEGLVMNEVQSSDHLPSAYPKIYSGAIEEGFRRLSTAQQDIIAIKIGQTDEEIEKVQEATKDEIMEAQEGRMEIRKIFSFLQILTACFGAFAHGGNDVSNAIGPLIAIWLIYHEGTVHQKSYTPLLILLYGGVGICCGLWVWGRRVIKTMGQDLTNLTPSRGFAIELMSAITVLAASNSGLPVSTTHCKVGAVVAVGWVRSREAVDWKIFRNIVVAWFITVPISGGLSALIFLIIRAAAGLDA